MKIFCKKKSLFLERIISFFGISASMGPGGGGVNRDPKWVKIGILHMYKVNKKTVCLQPTDSMPYPGYKKIHG